MRGGEEIGRCLTMITNQINTYRFDMYFQIKPVIMRHIQFCCYFVIQLICEWTSPKWKDGKTLVGFRLQMYRALKQPLTCSRR